MVHRFDVDVRWSDLDPYRHVNHATYLAYCDCKRRGGDEKMTIAAALSPYPAT